LTASKDYTDFIDKKVISIQPVKDESNQTLFYIVNYKKGGFLLLAGDQRVKPILAYSFENKFTTEESDKLNGISLWMELTKAKIKVVKEGKLVQSKEIKKLWKNIEKLGLSAKEIEPDPNDCEDSVFTVGPLTSTSWTQDGSFNNQLTYEQCNGVSKQVLVGCVPLAIAQVMKHFNFPTTFNYSNMPNTYANLTTQNFLKDIHDDAFNYITYSCNTGGGFVNTDVWNYHRDDILKIVYGYTNVDYGAYNRNTVKNNIGNNKIVIFGGTDIVTNDSHAWICDGYRESSYCFFDNNGNWISTAVYLDLYMKWGLGSQASDGWYSFDDFSPGVLDFDKNLNMNYNITP